MQQISQLDWQNVCNQLKVSDHWKKCYLGFRMSTVIIVPGESDTKKCYVLDHSSMRAFFFTSDLVLRVRNAISDLSQAKAYVREGFYDKSLNTEIYADPKTHMWCIEDWELSYEEMDKFVAAVNNMPPYQLM